MQLTQGAILSTQPELEYVAEIIGKSRDDIEKPGEQLSTEQIVKIAQRAELALQHAKSQAEYKQELQAKQSVSRSELISRLEEDEINLAKTRIENRMFRAPIILVPLALLLAAFGLAVLGVIDIKGQKVDVDSIVEETVLKLKKQLNTEGDKALNTINQALEENIGKINEYDVEARINNEVYRHVDDKGKNTLTRIESEFNDFKKKFPEKTLSETISKVSTTNNSAKILEERINKLEEERLGKLQRDLDELEGKIQPLSSTLGELEREAPDNFKAISILVQRSQWMIYAGLIGFVLGAVSLLLIIFAPGLKLRRH